MITAQNSEGFDMKALQRYYFLLVVCTILSACNVRTARSVQGLPPPYEYDFENAKPHPSVVVLPVIIDQSVYLPAKRNVLKPLVDSLNERVKELEWLAATQAFNISESAVPVLYFGTQQNRNPGFANENGPSVPGGPMVMSFVSSTDDWKAKVKVRLQELNADYIIFITLGFSAYAADPAFFSEQKIHLGTDYVIHVTWARNADDPIQVIHLLGALIDRNGAVVRMAAEGLLASPPTLSAGSILSGMIGGRDIIREEDVKSLASQTRRTDMSGEPLVLHVAIDNLLARLAGRPERLRRSGKK